MIVVPKYTQQFFVRVVIATPEGAVLILALPVFVIDGRHYRIGGCLSS